MTSERAVEVSLSETGENAFLRLSRGLPSLSAEFGEIAKGLDSLARDLVTVPTTNLQIGKTLSLAETLYDLSALSPSFSQEDQARVEKLAASIRAFKGWRMTHDLEVPQDSTKKESVGVFLRIPARLANQFPTKPEDPSPIHSTLLMVGQATHEEYRKIVGAVRNVAMSLAPFGVEVSDYGEFESKSGLTIPHMIPRSTGISLEELHKKLRAEVESAIGREADHYDGPFKAHITLGYKQPGQKYEGPRPCGNFTTKSLEVWGDPTGEFGRAVLEFCTGDLMAHTVAAKADASTADLARGGAASPSQGLAIHQKPNHDVTNVSCTCHGKSCSCAHSPGMTGPDSRAAEDSGSVSMSAPPVEKGNLEVPQDPIKKFTVRFVKRAEEDAPASEQRTVLGIVLEPETVDAQNDIYSAAEIEQSAWTWAEAFQKFGLMHNQIVPGVLLLETYLAPVAFEIGGVAIKKGTWLLRVRVVDDAIWAAVKSGALGGYSIGGLANRRPVKAAA